jgi:zinc transporter ZupT
MSTTAVASIEEEFNPLGLQLFSIFFFTALVFLALIPIKVPACKKSPRALSVLNAFAGGVFLSMAFVHILPEAVGQYQGWADDQEKAE